MELQTKFKCSSKLNVLLNIKKTFPNRFSSFRLQDIDRLQHYGQQYGADAGYDTNDPNLINPAVFFSDDAEANTGNHIVVDTVVVHEFVVVAIVVVLKPNLINLAVFFSNDAEPNTRNNIVVDGFFCLVF